MIIEDTQVITRNGKRTTFFKTDSGRFLKWIHSGRYPRVKSVEEWSIPPGASWMFIPKDSIPSDVQVYVKLTRGH